MQRDGNTACRRKIGLFLEKEMVGFGWGNGQWITMGGRLGDSCNTLKIRVHVLVLVWIEYSKMLPALCTVYTAAACSGIIVQCFELRAHAQMALRSNTLLLR